MFSFYDFHINLSNFTYHSFLLFSSCFYILLLHLQVQFTYHHLFKGKQGCNGSPGKARPGLWGSKAVSGEPSQWRGLGTRWEQPGTWPATPGAHQHHGILGVFPLTTESGAPQVCVVQWFYFFLCCKSFIKKDRKWLILLLLLFFFMYLLVLANLCIYLKYREPLYENMTPVMVYISSKKDQVLSTKEKAATCTVIADALVGAKSTDIQKLLSVGIETLLLLTADTDPDVRTNANESLNRVIRVSKLRCLI